MGTRLRDLIRRINASEQPMPPWSLGMGLGLPLVYLVTWFLALLVVINGADVSLEEPPDEIFAWVSLFAVLLSLPLLYMYLGSVQESHQMPLPQLLKLTPSINTPLWLTMLFGLGMVIIIDALGLLTGLAPDINGIPLTSIDPNTDFAPFLIAAIVVVVLRPIVEESIFRGVLYGALMKRMSHLMAVVVAALVFALIHFIIQPDIWWGALLPFSLGIVAGSARAATQSTQSAIGIHVMFGIFMVLRALLI